MNTYSVTYYPPGATRQPVTVTVQATDFVVQEDYVSFLDADTNNQAVLAIPRATYPIVTRTAVT